MAETIYINSISGKQGKYGIRLSGKIEKIIEELQKHVNEKGYINLEVLPKREPDRYGNTHYVKLDTWEPTKKNEATEEQKNYTAPAENKTSDSPASNSNVDDDLPF